MQTIKVINPGNPPPGVYRKLKKKGANMPRSRKRHKRRTHRKHHKNPAPVSYSVNGGRRKRSRVHHRFNPFTSHRSKHSRRHRRNPEATGSMAPSANNALELVAGAAIGGFVTPLLGTTFGLVGPMKYLAQVLIAYGLYVGGKALGFAKLGTAAAIAGAGVTAYQASQDYGIMAGANQLLGNTNDTDEEYWMNEFSRNLAAARAAGMNGIVPNGQMAGIVPADQRSFLTPQQALSNDATYGYMYGA